MTVKITKRDVFLYLSNKLDRQRRREIEGAYESDARVRQWFADLKLTEEERRQRPLPRIDLSSPEHRKLAALAYLSVEEDEAAQRANGWVAWIRALLTLGTAADPAPAEIVPSELLVGSDGSLVYRESMLALSSGQETPSVPPSGVPCVHPDHGGGRLIIRQAVDQFPDGIVEVMAVRRHEGKVVQTFRSGPIHLERVDPHQGEPYWYADIPLNSVIPDADPGDFIYCVAAAPKD